MKRVRGLYKSFLLATVAWLLVLTVSPSFAVDTPFQSLPLLGQAPPTQALTHIDIANGNGVSASQFISQGRAFYDQGQLASAAQRWQRAAQLYASQGDSFDQALSLSYLSMTYQDLGDWTQAESTIQQSLQLVQDRTALDTRESQILAQILNTHGSLQLALGQTDLALETWKQSAAVYGQAKDEMGQLGSQLNQAQALQTMGLYRQARTILEGLVTQVKSQPDTDFKAVTLRSLGSVFQVVGDLALSRVTLDQSLAISETLNQPLITGETLLVLANTLRALDQTDLAIQHYERIFQLDVTEANKLQAQLNLLSLLIDAQRWEQAQLQIAEIQPGLKDLQPSRFGVYSQVNFAESILKLKQKQPTEAGLNSVPVQDLAQILATAVRQAQTLQDTRAESYALGELGKLYIETQQWRDAKQLTQQAIQLAKDSNAKDIGYQWLWQLGKIYRQQGAKKDAIASYTEAVETLQTVKADLVATNSEIQFDFREKVEPVYRELVSLLLESDNVDQPSLRQARNLIEDLQLVELENYFRSACIDAQAAAIDQIDSEAAVIYPIILPDRLEVVLSLPGQPLKHYAKTISQADVDQTIDQLFVYFNPALSNQRRLQYSQELYNWLIAPAEADLSENQIKTLVFVLDGPLRNIPMGALFDGQQYLIEKYAVALTPGMQLLGPHFSQPKPLQALMLGVSEARQGFSSLPGVKREIEEISSTVDQSQVYLDQDFTKETLEDQLQATPYPILHLATHGQFSSSLTNTFLLSWDQKITLSDLDTLLQDRRIQASNPIELMVLSACQTAEGDNRATLGLAGLAVKSGARSTLATLWAVNDQSTVDLMTQFYKVLGQEKPATKSEALRQAQLELIQTSQYSHPFYWAPFVLVGNWLT